MSRKLSVWVVNYRSASLVAQSLEALKGQPIDEILVWDNASEEGDLELLQNLASSDRRIKVFRSTENIGFGAGINALADRSDDRPDDVIWILNPDTQLVSGSVAALQAQVVSGEFDVISPLLVCGDIGAPTVWFNGGGIDVRSGRCWHDGYGDRNWEVVDSSHRSQFITGAAPMMTRRVWDLLGGFHEGLFLYWEDVELSLRASELGVTSGVYQGCVVWHLEGGSGDAKLGHSVAYYFYNARNRIHVCGSRSGRLQMVLGAGIRESVVGVVRPLLRERQQRSRKFLAAIRGTVSGLLGVPALGPRRTAWHSSVEGRGVPGLSTTLDPMSGKSRGSDTTRAKS